MGTLVSTLFAFGAHADIFSFRVWESIVQYYHDISQEPHTTLDLLLAYFPQDSRMSSCNCIFMSFYCLIEPYAGFPNFEYQPYSPSLSHVQPCRGILYILCNLIPFLLGGDFPSSVDILHMCPCIEHVSLLSRDGGLKWWRPKWGTQFLRFVDMTTEVVSIVIFVLY